MKKYRILKIVIFMCSTLAMCEISNEMIIKHRGKELSLIYDYERGMRVNYEKQVEPALSFYHPLLSQEVCKTFKTYSKRLIETNEVIKNKNTSLNKLIKNVREQEELILGVISEQEGKDLQEDVKISFLPYGIDLTNHEVVKEIKEKYNNKNGDVLITNLNNSLIFLEWDFNLNINEESILSLYPDRLVEVLKDQILKKNFGPVWRGSKNINISDFKRGFISIESPLSFGLACDLTYGNVFLGVNGNISYETSFKHGRIEIVKIKKLSKELNNSNQSEIKVDSAFKAGMLMAEAINKTEFRIPNHVLKYRVYEDVPEKDFPLWFFSKFFNQFDWSPKTMTEENLEEIQKFSNYTKTTLWEDLKYSAKVTINTK